MELAPLSNRPKCSAVSFNGYSISFSKTKRYQIECMADTLTAGNLEERDALWLDPAAESLENAQTLRRLLEEL